jgi:VIT1/CCC1 family predicted Fe2+/Mn2+ transporter
MRFYGAVCFPLAKIVLDFARAEVNVLTQSKGETEKFSRKGARTQMETVDGLLDGRMGMFSRRAMEGKRNFHAEQQRGGDNIAAHGGGDVFTTKAHEGQR